MGAQALADPVYTAIDLGTGSPTFGNGTITGSNGLTYAFNPVQNDLPSQWQSTTQGVPIVQPAPVGDPMTYGDPNNAFSYSNLIAMNSQGLAVGINQYGVNGHLQNSEAFLTQQQPDGSWGAPISLWPGANTFAGAGPGIQIFGISPSGQVLGDAPYDNGASPSILYLYDSKSGALTNLNALVDSMTWTNSAQLSSNLSGNWVLGNMFGQLDNQGRILVQASQGLSSSDPQHYVLLVPEGVSATPLSTPEPATWAVFATLIGGLMVHQRLRARSGP